MDGWAVYLAHRGHDLASHVLLLFFGVLSVAGLVVMTFADVVRTRHVIDMRFE